MTWKSVLKNIEMDETVSCCEEARLKIVRWFEEHAAQLDSKDKLKATLIQMASDLSEQSCDDLYNSLEAFQEYYGEKSIFSPTNFELDKIMDEWDRCDTLAIQRMNDEKRNIEIHRK